MPELTALRRIVLLLLLALGGCVGNPATGPSSTATAKRPNILLIVAEDMSPRVGAYGDTVAQTPTLDALAANGVRYGNAFSVAGVCAPNRSSLITGVYTISMGTHQMRTGFGVPGTDVESYQAVPPPDVKAFPELLRAGGYATANFLKKDYQFGAPFTVWDVDAMPVEGQLDPALWRRLPADKPFFVMMNLIATHESRLAEPHLSYPARFAERMATFAATQEATVPAITDPADVTVPPYYPDTPAVRASIAQFYDNVSYVDGQVGDILAALEADGLADETVVIFTTDHGDPFPRAKRAVYDSGLRVPLILRYPDRAGAGTVRSELVSFVDVAPSILELAGVDVPGFIQGSSFLGGEERDYIFAARDRMDEIPDRVRAARDARYKYLRNEMRDVPYFRPLEYRDMFPIMRDWWAGLEAGTLNDTQRFYFEAPRPAEELYDTEADPWEVNNLADDPQHADALARLRAALDEWIDDVGDWGAVPEIHMVEGMWPGFVQPVTAAPVGSVEPQGNGSATLTLSSETAGASLGYRVGDGAWQLYSRPVAVQAEAVIEAKAIRYGYRESEVATIGDPVFDTSEFDNPNRQDPLRRNGLRAPNDDPGSEALPTATAVIAIESATLIPR